MTLVQPESELFDIAPVSEVESSGNIQLAQGGEQTFTVQPKLGLSAKDDPYVEELVFASDESTEASATVTASVMVKDVYKRQEKMCRYNEMTDEALIERLRAGESAIADYLMEKYKGLVRKKARAMFLIGGDTDDLIQEGMIGLFKAVRDYQPDRESSFQSFANICIDRQIYTAIKSSNRQKHQPLNTYVSLSDGEAEENFRDSCVAVSYTHLAVYKRQCEGSSLFISVVEHPLGYSLSLL